MKRAGLAASFCCVALVSSNTFAATEGLGLQWQFRFGSESAPQRMELALQAPRALLGSMSDEVEVRALNAPLLVSERGHGHSRTTVLGMPLGGDPLAWRLNADGSDGGHPWLWTAVAVVGVTALVVGLAGGGGKKDDQDRSEPGPGCTVLDPNSGDGDDLTVIGNCNP